MRRRTPPVQHREFFRAMNSEEVIACLCTCTRAADHWYGAPIGAPALTAEDLLGSAEAEPEPVRETAAHA
ncbi:hypothetical protein [Agromyces sp. NPDC060279]|uniref:hypothetical protein n=1 Tax=Agromyces sp. NPDC060279 TaxID=3347092 RepID=UPI0036517232